MSTDAHAANRASEVPGGYRFWRSVVRFWFALSSHKVRLLNAAKAEEETPAVFAISHPASFREALILITAFEREIHCLVERRTIQGRLREFLATRLGMIPYDESEEGWASAHAACSFVLSGGGAVTVFASKPVADIGRGHSGSQIAARVLQEAESRESGSLRVSLFPLHVLQPPEGSRSRESLVYVGSPVGSKVPAGAQGEAAAPDAGALTRAIEARFQDNAFRLQPEDMELFLQDLEELLRLDLAEQWSSRPRWKQDAEGFKLSSLVGKWAEQVNILDPGRLISIRESLEACREMRRRSSLHRLEVEAAGTWLRSALQRVAVYVESVIGLLVAAYGLLNHLAILCVLYLAGSFRKHDRRDPTTEWTIRVAVVLGFYTLQVLLLAHFEGRAAAGYYAPTLPLTGAYLLRYVWLLRHRTRLAVLELLMPAQTRKVRRMRSQFLQEIDRSLRVDEEALGVSR